jgi:hypothetical protein
MSNYPTFNTENLSANYQPYLFRKVGRDKNSPVSQTGSTLDEFLEKKGREDHRGLMQIEGLSSMDDSGFVRRSISPLRFDRSEVDDRIDR